MEVDIHTTPSEDVASAAAVFRSVESTVNGLRVALLSITRAIEDRIAHQHRRRNSSVPIHSLPHELLSTILLATFSNTEPKKVERLQGLSQVCYTWWTTIKTSPRFWDTLQEPQLRPDVCLLALRKSAAVPLTIIWNAEHPSDAHPSFQECIERISGQRNRWQSVRVHVSDMGGLESCFQHQLPLLERLTLLTHPGVPLRVAGGLRLRSLDVTNVISFLPLRGSGFAALESLQLMEISATMEDFLTTLEECPSLRNVGIQEFNATTRTAPAVNRIIVLPLLKRLTLAYISAEVILYILRRIRADGLRDLCVDVLSNHTEGDHSTQLLHHLIQPDSLWNTANTNQVIETIGVEFTFGEIYETEEIVLEGAGRIRIHNPDKP